MNQLVSFESDYNNGVHPLILQRLVETNDERASGYGADRFCASARQKIREACGLGEAASVFFLVGGTQTNATVIDALLRSYEGVVTVSTGHINRHESGAVEASRHKVLSLAGSDGKLSAETLNSFLQQFAADPNAPHRVQPGMVYITFPTECGTLYSRAELAAVYDVCRRHGLPLYIDGARLGYGLESPKCEFDLEFLAHHCDVFYIGGTKVGAICGEAVVFSLMPAPRSFFTIQKQHGAVLAKGRLLGIQFDTLFSDGLYFKISHHAIDMARDLCAVFASHGISPAYPAESNQLFFPLEKGVADQMSRDVVFEQWLSLDDNRAVYRFVTSWATTPAEISALDCALARTLGGSK